MNRKQSGFTLVEIAIVLVIIGLLLGGILKGQEMINQAKIKNVVSDFNGIASALYGYEDRYRQLPGDDANAATRWTIGPPACATGTPGNGIIEGTYSNSSASPTESNCFWQQLRLAGFVAGQGTGTPALTQPTNAASSMIGVQTGSGATPPTPVMIGPSGGGFSSLMMCSTGLPDKIAIAVDVQLDDGLNNAGTMRGQLQTAPNPTIEATLQTIDAYVENGSNTYTICKTM